MKNGKIAAFEFKRQLEFGKVYTITMDNGDKGEEVIAAKENYEPKIGDEWKYDLEKGQYGPKIKRPKEGKSGGKGGGSPRGPEPFKVSSMSIAYAKDLVVAGKIEVKETTAYAQKFYDWIKERE